MSFASRQDAGQKLARHLVNEGVHADVVAGLPRGGVVVAAEVAHALKVPLDVLVVRKIGHPLHREFAIGALAENDVVLLNDHALGASETTRVMVRDVIHEEQERLHRYKRKFQLAAVDFCDKTVLLVDDGLATGSTMEAAVLSARRKGAREIRVAVPVASTHAVEKLERVTNGVFVLITDPGFEAVGAYYRSFAQTSDEEVIELLRAEHAEH